MTIFLLLKVKKRFGQVWNRLVLQSSPFSIEMRTVPLREPPISWDSRFHIPSTSLLVSHVLSEKCRHFQPLIHVFHSCTIWTFFKFERFAESSILGIDIYIFVLH